MKSAARFLLLLAAGVGIMVLYVRSDDSFLVLVLSLITLLAGLAIWAVEPWKADDGDGAVDDAGAGRGDRPRDAVWRCGHDVTWDERGVLAVAIGDRLPALTVWSRVDDITVGRHRATADERTPQRRLGLRLELYRPTDRATDPSDVAELWLCLGPDQDPRRLASELTAAWRQVAARRWYPGPRR